MLPSDRPVRIITSEILEIRTDTVSSADRDGSYLEYGASKKIYSSNPTTPYIQFHASIIPTRQYPTSEGGVAHTQSDYRIATYRTPTIVDTVCRGLELYWLTNSDQVIYVTKVGLNSKRDVYYFFEASHEMPSQ